ncbi:signal transduction histidine kinase [Motilibacter peucedani]|uniref:histidine kinase n=1 Tax=Motilibacter peucedani TaxID=598650 RepID=A0A420XTA2_9ACTN|nr:histidine kinase [Motilibacter peucedani]RKS80058.1 signal transduction histidine kinase [Motilibacter peucedani]
MAAAVLVFSLASREEDGRQGAAWSWLLAVALAVPLLARRRAPFAVLLVQSAVAFTQWLVDTQPPADLAFLAGLYAVGAYDSRRPPIVASALIAEVGVVLATLKWAPPGHSWSALVLLTGTVTAAWVLGVHMRTRRAYLASVLERAATAERERDQQGVIAAASERARIAREMHDIVAHSLSVIIALSDGASATVRRDPEEAAGAMDQVSRVGRQALSDTRRLLGVLRSGDEPELEPAPGVDQLDGLIRDVRGAGLPVELVVEGRVVRLAPSAQLAAYRLVQESLTNVLKHAPSATGASVLLRYGPEVLDIEVTNDAAPDGTSAAGAAGHGIRGMSERLTMFGGNLEAAPRPGGGWRVAGSLHLDPDRRNQ